MMWSLGEKKEPSGDFTTFWSFFFPLDFILAGTPFCSIYLIHNRHKTGIYLISHCNNTNGIYGTICIILNFPQQICFPQKEVANDWNHYFGLGPIPKPKLADTFGRYCNRYQNHISKLESSYLPIVWGIFSSQKGP